MFFGRQYDQDNITPPLLEPLGHVLEHISGGWNHVISWVLPTDLAHKTVSADTDTHPAQVNDTQVRRPPGREGRDCNRP